MKLLTKELEKKLQRFPLYSQDGKGNDAQVVCKFFCPWGNWTWYVLEASKLPNGDYTFFGIVDGFEREYGYFTLSQLESVKGPFGLTIERDKYFDAIKVGELPAF